MNGSTEQDDWARITLRLPRDLHEMVRDAARRDDRTANGQIVAMLRTALQKQQPQEANA